MTYGLTDAQWCLASMHCVHDNLGDRWCFISSHPLTPLFGLRNRCCMCSCTGIPPFFDVPAAVSESCCQHRHRGGFNGLIYVRLMRVGGPQPQIHWIEWTCAHFNTLTKLSITAKANWQPLTQTQTIPIDRLLSSHLKNMLLMGEWGTWNHFQGDIKAALWGGVVVITPHRPALKKAI